MSQRNVIVCLSSIDWDFLWQGHQEVMSAFAKAGHSVLFVENTGVRGPRFRDLPRIWHRLQRWSQGINGIRLVQENLFVCSPLVLPFPYAWWARLPNRWILTSTIARWLRIIGSQELVLWTFLPTGLTLDVMKAIRPRVTVYYCIDSFEDSSPQARKILRTEPEVVRRADLVFVTSKRLQDRCLQWRDEAHLFPFGVKLEAYEAARNGGVVCPAELASIPAPRIGYIGGIHQWVDQELICRLAERFPAYSFVLVGPAQTDVSALHRHRNVHQLGQKPGEQLPAYVKQFDVCIIPYRLTEYTAHVYPTKLNEYLALSKPVVSTRLPEVERFSREHGEGMVWLADSAEQFAAQITDALAHQNGALAEQRYAVARSNSWTAKIHAMEQLIEAKLDERRQDELAFWRERLWSWYRANLRRLASVCVALLLVYGIVFKTPLVWWIAEPLRVVEAPRQADVIVVFGGGVGESGQAGQGYEERVLQAVQLYRRGLASRVIFSTGYGFALNETKVMNALAVSEGIPSTAIILEQQAANTYQNVVYCSHLMTEHGWRSALLVSSPYHMRRALLTWRHIAPEMTIIPVPREPSLFYGTHRAVQVKHIRGILHEYTGILYYWAKGYLDLYHGSHP